MNDLHAQNNFGHAPQSTSYIESVWGDLKRLLSKIYVSVKSDNFIYFGKNANIEKKLVILQIMKKLLI
jgi:hypothetical protein